MKYSTWVLFFTEDGIHPCGSDASHHFNLMPQNAEKRIHSKHYHTPKWAASYIVISDDAFRNFTCEQIYQYNARYGKHLPRS